MDHLFARRGRGFQPLGTLDAQEPGGTLEAIEQEALANLARFELGWARGEFDVSGEKVEMLACLDAPNADVKILDRAFLMAAADTLEVKSLCVAIPRVGAILTINMESPLKAQRRFAGMVAKQHARAGDMGLTPAVFCVRAGEIVGMAEWIPGPEGQDVAHVRAFILTNEQTGRKTQGLNVVAPDVESLAGVLEQALSKVIEEKLCRLEYEPTVLVGVVRATAPDMTGQRAARLRGRLLRFMRRHPIQSPTGRPYEIELTLEE